MDEKSSAKGDERDTGKGSVLVLSNVTDPTNGLISFRYLITVSYIVYLQSDKGSDE